MTLRYATVAELKSTLNIASTTDDLVLEMWLEAAEEAVDRTCNRPDGFLADSAASARHYVGTGKPWQPIDECVEITEVAVRSSITADDYTAWTSPTTNFAGDGDWIPAAGSGKHPTFNSLPFNVLLVDIAGDESYFTSGRAVDTPGWPPEHGEQMAKNTVRVTAKWGYAVAVPNVIRNAAIAQAGRWYKRGMGGWTDTLASVDQGQMIYRQPMDPDIRMMLVCGRYVRQAVGGGTR
jgi:hypothetical protein